MRTLIGGLVIATVISGGAIHVGQVQATPASGFTPSTIAKGRFENIDVTDHVFLESLWHQSPRQTPWLQNTKGTSDLYVRSNIWAPHGTTGWHTHPGQSLIIVTSGTVTAYEADDASCMPREYKAGMAFVDPGGGHVHVLRNEDSVEARTVTVQLMPAGADRRIDAAGNSACLF